MNCIAFFDPGVSSNTGKISGMITFHQCSPEHNTIVHITLSGVGTNKIRGIHIHEAGDLSQGCTSACSHYNPYDKLHGSEELYGTDRHVGDMCNNITGDKNGKVDIIYEDELIDLYGTFSVVGRSVVIHEKDDDLGRYREDKDKRGVDSGKTGNAGGRVACAVIGLSKTNFHP